MEGGRKKVGKIQRKILQGEMHKGVSYLGGDTQKHAHLETVTLLVNCPSKYLLSRSTLGLSWMIEICNREGNEELKFKSSDFLTLLVAIYSVLSDFVIINCIP